MDTWIKFITAISGLVSGVKTLRMWKILLIFVLSYPIVAVFVFQTEFRMLISDKEDIIEVSNLAATTKRAYEFNHTFGAEATMVYIYQPTGPRKMYKERVHCASDTYVPLSSTCKVDLVLQSDVSADLKDHGYSIATPHSKHYISRVLGAYNYEYAYFFAIYDIYDDIVGEVIMMFLVKPEVDVKEMFDESQMFVYDMF